MRVNGKEFDLRIIITIGAMLFAIGISWGQTKVATDSLREDVIELKAKQEIKVDTTEFEKVEEDVKKTRETVIRMEEQLNNIKTLLEGIEPQSLVFSAEPGTG